MESRFFMQKYVIIVAGGSGKRMGTELPKQFLPLAGKPMLMHTIEAFYNTKDKIEIIVILPSEHIGLWKNMCVTHNFSVKHNVTEGGEERFYSVKNGLAKVIGDSLVAIHDGARPLVDSKTINKAFALAQTTGAVIPVTAPSESVRVLHEDGESMHLDRNKVRMVQTPQVFSAKILREAYQQPFSTVFTDDASIVESAGFRVSLIDGCTKNIKITDPQDMVLAETLLQLKNHGTKR